MRIFQRILKPLESEVLLSRDVQQGIVRTGKGLDIINVCPYIPRKNLCWWIFWKLWNDWTLKVCPDISRQNLVLLNTGLFGRPAPVLCTSWATSGSRDVRPWRRKLRQKFHNLNNFSRGMNIVIVISLCPSLPGSPNSSLLVQPSTSEDEIFLAKGLKMNNFDKLFGKRFVYKECVNVVAAATNHPCLQTSLELDRCWRERVVNATFGLHGGAFLLCEDFSFVVFPWSHKTQSS